MKTKLVIHDIVAEGHEVTGYAMFFLGGLCMLIINTIIYTI